MPRYSLTQTVAPAAEPITLDEAKLHLRVDSTDEDTLVTGLIKAAREMAEAYTRRQFITATFTAKYNNFPDSGGDICIPRTPLGSVSSITYTDSNGSARTLSTDVYEIISDDTESWVVLKPLQSWPSAQSGKRNGVVMTFTAGYGPASTDVPEAARSGMLMLIGHLYENRESVVTGTTATALPIATKALLDSVSVRGPA